MATKKHIALFNGSPVRVGDFLRIEIDEGVLPWTMVNKIEGPVSVRLTILEEAGKQYPMGRYMVVFLKYAREHRSKDNPPPLWGVGKVA